MPNATDAMDLFYAGDLDNAAIVASQVLKSGRDIDALLVLARVANEYGALTEAADIAQAATETPGSDARCFAQLAYQRMRLGNAEGAEAAAKSALAMPTISAETYDLLGAVFQGLRNFTSAAEMYRLAAHEDPANSQVQTNLGSALTICGALDEAQNAYHAAIRSDPTNARALAALSEVRKATAQDNNISLITAAISHAKTPMDNLVLHHALAREKEALEDFKGAFDALDTGKRAMIAGLGRPLHDDIAMFKGLSQLSLEMKGKAGFPDERPIFVVGAPRSGTTLAERILSNGTDVLPLGESPAFPALVKQASGSSTPHMVDVNALLATWRHLDFARIGESYIRYMVGQNGGHRFVDKLPLNALLIDVILTALPNARIIRMTRDPLDAVIGNYRQMFEFESGSFDYTLTPSRAAAFLNGLRDFTDKIVEKHPDRILTVDLATLVGHSVSTTKQMFDFCGLSWTPDVVAIENNTSPAGSASAVQVRSPISNKVSPANAYYRERMSAAIANGA